MPRPTQTPPSLPEGSLLHGIEGELINPFTTISAMVKLVNARLKLLRTGASSDQFVVFRGPSELSEAIDKQRHRLGLPT